MKFVLTTLLLFAIVSSWPKSLYSENFADSLNKDLADLLSKDNASKVFKKFDKDIQKKSISRKLSNIEYERLKRKYNNLKDKYQNLLFLYKTKGYLSQDVPTELGSQIDLSSLPKKHARRLVKLKNMAKKHHRKMQDIVNDYHYYDYDFMPSDSDSWLTSAAKKTANALGIHNKVDALTAGVGVGALAYGFHHRKKTRNTKRTVALKMQKLYVLKEGVAKMLGREIRNLTRLVEMIDEISRRTTKTNDNICANIDNQSIIMGRMGY